MALNNLSTHVPLNSNFTTVLTTGGGGGGYGPITAVGQGISSGSAGTISGTSFFDTISKVEERLTKIEERLLIINPDEKLLAKYPGLKQAYDHYLLMEKLCRE